MSASRLCLGIAVTLVLAAQSSGGVAGAQSEAKAAVPVAVTATRDCQGIGDAQVQIDDDGTEHLRFLVSRCTLTSTDASIADPYILVTHTDCYPGGSCALWGTIEPEGPDGWRGAYRGWVDEAGRSYTVSALEGSGAYEGFTFVNRGMGDLGLGDPSEVEGVIYAGTPPPWDETLPE
jgi:hypothetical protein